MFHHLTPVGHLPVMNGKDSLVNLHHNMSAFLLSQLVHQTDHLLQYLLQDKEYPLLYHLQHRLYLVPILIQPSFINKVFLLVLLQHLKVETYIAALLLCSFLIIDL